MNRTVCPEDFSFGPQTSQQCRDGLDLTLVFEQSILGLLPASFMIFASIARYLVLRKSRQIVPGKSFYDTKSMHLTVLMGLRLVLLLLWTIRSPVRTQTSIATASVFLVESFMFVILSKAEHVRSIRPSTLLSIYYLFSLGLDFIRMRTLVKLQFDTLISSLCAADMAVKASLLFLEAQNKRAYFSAADKTRPPQEISGVLNRSVFWWLNSLFLQGYRKVLILADLFPLDEELSSEKTFDNFEAKWLAMGNIKHYRLGKTVILCLWRLFSAPVLPNLLAMGLTFGQPFLVQSLLKFISSSDSKEFGYLIVAGYAGVFIGNAIFTAVYTHQLDRFVTMLRGCLVNIIYNQSLKLDLKEAAGGESLTLMSADVEHIVKGFGLIHVASANASMAIAALGLLYRELGLTFVAPLIFSAVLSYITGSGSGSYIQTQNIWLEATEKRVSFSASVISSMKGVKILGLVDVVSSKITSLRQDEVQKGKKVRMWNGIFTLLQTLSLSGTRWITYTVFGIVTLLKSSNSGLNISVLFTSLSILNIFMEQLEILLRGIPRIASAFGCLHRIENFLLLETKRDNRLVEGGELEVSVVPGVYELQDRESSDIAISIKELSVGWTREQVVIEGITLEILRGSVTMVIGPVGCGKSTLMHALLGETVTHKGFISVAHANSMAYCGQTPWLINKSVQQNILGQSLFDAPWYAEVIKACALVEDFRNYQDGDRTLVGSKGVTLSGGQRQRIALARAVYSRKPIMVLDDIFSGLDTITEEHIARSLLGSDGILRRGSQTVILATHAVHLLEKADMIILLGEDSKVVYQGDLANFQKELISMRDLDSTAEEAHLSKSDIVERLEQIDDEDFIPILHPVSREIDTAAPDISRQMGNSRLWGWYIKTMGVKHALLSGILGAICMGFTPAQGLWLNAWANDQQGGKIGLYVGVYSIFFVGEIALTVVWIWHAMYFPLIASSIKLHHIQLSALMSATMSFFSTTDTGEITNRFSQDLNLIDAELPLTMVDFVEYVWNNIFKMVLIAVATAYIIPVFPLLLGTFWLIQRFYLRTSRQLRFIDLETKAPLYTHFIESMSGLATIRGFSWEEDFANQNRTLLQASQRPFFILATIQRWLTLVLNLVVAALAVLLSILAVELRTTISPGLLGLALVNVMGLALSLHALVSFWTDLETSIGAVSRIRSFSLDTPSEDPSRLGKVSDKWLHSGGIEFKNVSAAHGPDSPPVLRDINLTVSPGEHVGICGRSGSGKSSLIGVLFRILEASTGAVLIDGVDISSISINQVRRSLNSLSQETFFLHGSIRDNLAMASSQLDSDSHLQAVLTRVGLWNKVVASGGLDTSLDADELFSHGERQLFALARAMLHPSKILVLDEFTSNVDIDTDWAMQKIIRQDFKDRTIIAVAHRLETILDFDRIVVVDQGRLIEQGSPSQLLKSNSAFGKLYNSYKNK